MNDIAEAERRLAEAQAQIQAAHDRQDWDGLGRAFDEELSAGRDLARLRGAQFAVPIDLGIQWDVGAPLPHVLSDGHRTMVLFYRREVDPNWDGTYVTIVDPANPSPAVLGPLEFSGTYLVKFGGLNDEAISGHPLHGRGLAPYSAHLVHNSEWISEAEQQNSVHPSHRGGWHERLNHYLLCFHDETLELLARDVRAEAINISMRDALVRAAQLLLARDGTRES